jgi:hypothetical protein
MPILHVAKMSNMGMKNSPKNKINSATKPNSPIVINKINLSQTPRRINTSPHNITILCIYKPKTDAVAGERKISTSSNITSPRTTSTYTSPPLLQ